VKFFIDNWYLFLGAAVSGMLLLWPILTKGIGGSAQVSTAEAVSLMNRNKAVLIDVSEPAEYAAGHAKGTKNAPLGQLEASTALPKNKALPLVVICPTGARAGRAVPILKKLGFEHVVVLSGGFAAWRTASLPVEKSAEKMAGKAV
jgi:rhodanese-related sulfurtransferase